MKAIDFKESNNVYGEKQFAYKNLHALVLENGYVVTCWKLSFWDKAKVLFTGKVWLSLITHAESIPPQLITVNKPFYYDRGK